MCVTASGGSPRVRGRPGASRRMSGMPRFSISRSPRTGGRPSISCADDSPFSSATARWRTTSVRRDCPSTTRRSSPPSRNATWKPRSASSRTKRWTRSRSAARCGTAGTGSPPISIPASPNRSSRSAGRPRAARSRVPGAPRIRGRIADRPASPGPAIPRTPPPRGARHRGVAHGRATSNRPAS